MVGWIATTGGSFAKMSLKIARKSRMVDLSQKVAQPTRYGWKTWP